MIIALRLITIHQRQFCKPHRAGFRRHDSLTTLKWSTVFVIHQTHALDNESTRPDTSNLRKFDATKHLEVQSHYPWNIERHYALGSVANRCGPAFQHDPTLKTPSGLICTHAWNFVVLNGYRKTDRNHQRHTSWLKYEMGTCAIPM